MQYAGILLFTERLWPVFVAFAPLRIPRTICHPGSVFLCGVRSSCVGRVSGFQKLSGGFRRLVALLPSLPPGSLYPGLPQWSLPSGTPQLSLLQELSTVVIRVHCGDSDLSRSVSSVRRSSSLSSLSLSLCLYRPPSARTPRFRISGPHQDCRNP